MIGIGSVVPPILVLLLRMSRIVAQLYNHCCLIPRPILCCEPYILRKRLICGCMRLVPLCCTSIWSGRRLVSSSLFANANTILLSSSITSTCWSSLSLMIPLVMVPECGNLTLPSWTMKIIVLLSLLSGPSGSLIILLRRFLPSSIGGTEVNFISGR